MLNNCGEQPENSHDNEAGPENQRAVRKIEPCMQTCRLEVSVELSDSEPKPNQREGGPKSTPSACALPPRDCVLWRVRWQGSGQAACRSPSIPLSCPAHRVVE